MKVLQAVKFQFQAAVRLVQFVGLVTAKIVVSQSIVRWVRWPELQGLSGITNETNETS